MKRPWMLKFINFWPPFLGAGVRVRNVSDDFRKITVDLKFRFWNKNYVGTQFGGSIYAMTDPFYMLMLIKNLGDDYIIWDKAATVRFLKPGRGKLTAEFNLTGERLNQIKKAADENYKTEPVFKVEIRDESGELIAEVDKVLYVRRKDRVAKPKNPS